MSYALVGYGAATSSTRTSIASRMPTRFTLAPRTTDTSTTPGLMDPGQITPERCKAAGWWWDEVAQQCLKEAPEQPAPQPDPTVPPPPQQELPPLVPEDYDPVQDCLERGGCWDPVDGCVLCMDEEGEPSPPPPEEPPVAPPEEEDNTAMCIGLALLGAAALAGGWFLISRKKKKGKA